MNKPIINFTVPGAAVGKGRPRFTTSGTRGYDAKTHKFNPGVMVYTPTKTSNYESLVQATFMQHYPGFQALEEPVYINIHTYITPPSSANKMTKAAMLAGEIPPTKKPDIDNIAKSILDALNGVAYSDDKFVTSLMIEKHYGDTDETKITIIPARKE